MNRKKKRDSILKKRLKKAKAKLAPKSRSGYVAKAQREKLDFEEPNIQEELVSDKTTSITAQE